MARRDVVERVRRRTTMCSSSSWKRSAGGRKRRRQIGDDDAAFRPRDGIDAVVAARRRRTACVSARPARAWPGPDRRVRSGIVAHGSPLMPSWAEACRTGRAARGFPSGADRPGRGCRPCRRTRGRRPREPACRADTFARSGLSCGSKASSVTLKSVSRTGTMRAALHTKRLNGASIGMISSVPACASAKFACRVADGG